MKLENVSIANALQLEAARCRAVPIPFYTSPVASLKSLSLSVAVLERFYCLYVTLRCDLELWPWTFVVCRLCSLNFYLMTLNMYHVLRYALRYFTQSLNSVKLSVHEIWWFFHANTSWPLTCWPWKFVVDMVARSQPAWVAQWVKPLLNRPHACWPDELNTPEDPGSKPT